MMVLPAQLTIAVPLIIDRGAGALESRDVTPSGQGGTRARRGGLVGRSRFIIAV